jgi:hypothetical protein
MKTVSAFVSRHPWIYIVLAFVVLITAWSTLISIAVKFTPQRIEVSR